MPTRAAAAATPSHHVELTLSSLDNRALANLCGPLDENLRQLEAAFEVRIARRGSRFDIEGPKADAARAAEALERFAARAEHTLTPEDIQLGLVELRANARSASRKPDALAPIEDELLLQTRRADLHGQDVPCRRVRRRRIGARRRQADRAGAAGRRGRREARLPAR